MTAFIACYKSHLRATGNRCAAELLNFFKNYKPNRKDGWLIITIGEIKEKLLDTWGRDSIRKACKLLDDLGLIKRDHPRLNKRAWMYKFVADELVEKPTTVVEEPTTTYIKDPNLDPSLNQEQREKENGGLEEPELIQTNSLSSPPKPVLPVKKQVNSCGSNSLRRESLSKSKNSAPEWDWVPDGPWKLDGKIDSELVEWQARRWLVKGWGIDIHEARKKVRAYYKNDVTRLANDWQEYQEATAHKLANVVVREKNGVAVAQSEKQQLSAQISRAFEPNPHSFSNSNVGEVTTYKKWLDTEKTAHLNSADAGTEVDWDELATLVEDWENSQIEEICGSPVEAEHPQAFTSQIREEDRDWAYQQYLKAVNQSQKQNEKI